MKKILRNLRGLIVFSGMTLNTIFWFVPIFLFALVKLAVPVAGFRRLITRALMKFGENWISVNGWVLAGAGAREWRLDSNAGLRPDGWYLMISNHQTWVDILVLQAAFNRQIPFLKFFIKQQLIWFPFLGVAWWALDMPFMKRHSPSYLAKHPEKKGSDLEATRKACEKFRYTPTTVINFVEGTRFSEEKRDRRNSPYRHLLKPRAGGMAMALSSMGEMFDALLDVTILYPDGVPDFWGLCCGDRVRAIVTVDEIDIEDRLVQGDYQNDREFRRYVHRWIGEIWKRKDRQIAESRGGSQLDAGVA